MTCEGGGTREISVPIQSSHVELLSIMKEVYFPDGMSTFGDADIMTFKVGNFKDGEVEEQFTLAMDGMREGLRDGDFENLWNFSKEDVRKMYHMMKLTPQRVIAMLAEEPSTHLNKSRAKILSYLKKYISYLSRKELGQFLRYVTGSPVPVFERIKVMLHVNE